MVRTGGEEEFKGEARLLASERGLDWQFYFFKRKLRLGGSRAGQLQEKPLFPGYVFMQTETLDAAAQLLLHGVRNFFHFLPRNADVQPLHGSDLECLNKFISFGETAGFSRARFDENDRIVVVDGPLKGFVGNIVRVNRRKQRVTVRLDLCNNVSSFDLCYEDIGKAPAKD